MDWHVSNSSFAINESEIWKKLENHQQQTKSLHMKDLFATDDRRFEKMHETIDGFMFDYSKNRITEETLSLLFELANTVDLSKWINKMKIGDKINISENRRALHYACRLPVNSELIIDGSNVVPDIHNILDAFLDFAENIRSGNLKGFTGENFTDVVNLGIGGSDLGVRALKHALFPYCSKELKVHFVANVDYSDLAQTLENLNPRTTLFIVSSKSFSSAETIENAKSAREWILRDMPDTALPYHFVAVTNNEKKAIEFGVSAENIFFVPNSVGGRFSSTSAVGLSLACAIGEKNFRQLLLGAHAMDKHFFNTPIEHNIPILAALIAVWYNAFYRSHSQAIIPYHHGLRFFPQCIQQLDMESCGKRVSIHGKELNFDTSAIIWGQEGSNGQHSFFQLLHQGSRLVPCDFIIVVNDAYQNARHQRMLVGNAIAQTLTLMKGVDEANLKALPNQEFLLTQKHLPGNRPSNTIMIEELNPYYLGMLLAMYEHKIFVQSVIFGVNAFDQWGVEQGKVCAKEINQELNNNQIRHNYDSSTNAQLEFFLKHYKNNE